MLAEIFLLRLQTLRAATSTSVTATSDNRFVPFALPCREAPPVTRG